jgi:hypothetical protein
MFASGRGTALDTQNTVIGRRRHSDRTVAITHDRGGLFPRLAALLIGLYTVGITGGLALACLSPSLSNDCLGAF